MKKGSTLFLKIVIFLIGTLVFVGDLALISVAFSGDDLGEYRLLLFIICITSLPFFYGLYQLLNLLNYIDKNKGFSEQSIRSLKYIKYCAILVSVVYTIAMPFVYKVARQDDAPGVIALGLIFVFISVVVATLSAVLEKLVQNGVEIKSENDLTV